jgi:septal ring factor EnvC (AmiA/AmiB activator)
MALSKRSMSCLGFVLAAFCGQACGQIYKCPDGAGRSTYTNVKSDTVGKNCALVTKEVSVVPAAQVAPRTVSSSGSSNAQNERRKILESELQNEQQLLAGAKQQLAEQESTRSGDERNYARVLDRLKPYQDAVDQHSKNIDQIQNELGRLK